MEKAYNCVHTGTCLGHPGNMGWRVPYYVPSNPCTVEVWTWVALLAVSSVKIGFCQSCPLSLILFIIFMPELLVAAWRMRGLGSVAWRFQLCFLQMAFGPPLNLRLKSSVGKGWIALSRSERNCPKRKSSVVPKQWRNGAGDWQTGLQHCRHENTPFYEDKAESKGEAHCLQSVHVPAARVDRIFGWRLKENDY